MTSWQQQQQEWRLSTPTPCPALLQTLHAPPMLNRLVTATTRRAWSLDASRTVYASAGCGKAWVGCSHWTTPFRPQSICRYTSRTRDAGIDDLEGLNSSDEHNDATEGVEGIIVDQVEPELKSHGSSKLDRPSLPTSIKKLNRLLSHDRSIDIPDSDLIERFVKGRGPGGQAINKTNSSVSLTHIPTGIRVQSQPTRSREENRKIARRILMERLDLLRSHEAAAAAAASASTVTATEAGQSRKEREKELAGVWSREEIRWEKERRRKANRAKKSNKKKKDKRVEVREEDDGGD